MLFLDKYWNINDNKIINSEAKFKNSEIAFKTTPKYIIKGKKII